MPPISTAPISPSMVGFFADHSRERLPMHAISLLPDQSVYAIASARRRWSLALLFSASALNLFDRQIINILAQDIKTDLAISDAQLGLLTGTAFGIFYAVFGLPLG